MVSKLEDAKKALYNSGAIPAVVDVRRYRRSHLEPLAREPARDIEIISRPSLTLTTLDVFPGSCGPSLRKTLRLKPSQTRSKRSSDLAPPNHWSLHIRSRNEKKVVHPKKRRTVTACPNENQGRGRGVSHGGYRETGQVRSCRTTSESS